LRPYQVATAAFFILIAAVAMFDTRSGALPDPTGTAPGGLRSGWYPFWSAALVALAAGAVIFQAMTRPQPAEGAFKDRHSLLSVVQLVIPMIVVVYLMSEKLLGFYIASGLYMAYFALVTVRYRWYWALASGLITPIVLFLVFEIGFRAIFPKSFLYPGLPF
jgi:Tripartite tricarboxylate transporter TctB family